MSRAGQVVGDVMAGHRAKVWLPEACSAQQNHRVDQQTCLAHLARDLAYQLVEKGTIDRVSSHDET